MKISEEIKEWFKANNDDVFKYETEYFRDKGIKRWTIMTKDKKKTIFEEDFDFSFFDKSTEKICGCKRGIAMKCSKKMEGNRVVEWCK